MTDEKKDEVPSTPEAKLDAILKLLQSFEKRDKLRTRLGLIGGFIRMIPILVTIVMLVYFYQNGERIMNDMIQKAAQQATEMAGESTTIITESLSTDEIMERLKTIVPQ